MAWVLLAATIALEVAGTTMMKLSNGFTQLWPSIGVILFYSAALVGMTRVMQDMQLSVVYSVWSGAGTAIIAAIGIAYFREPISLSKVLSLACVITGIVGLQMSAGN